MTTHRCLSAFRGSMELAKKIYKITAGFPKEDLHGITNQIRFAAVSVPSTMSEGAGRKSSLEYMSCLRISLGNLTELETLLIFAFDIGLLKGTDLHFLHEKIKIITAQLTRLMASSDKKMAITSI